MHEHNHEHGQHHHHEQRPKRPLHHDWRLWAAVVLMLVAMFVYIYSFDEADAPGGDGVREPAAGAPAAP